MCLPELLVLFSVFDIFFIRLQLLSGWKCLYKPYLLGCGLGTVAQKGGLSWEEHSQLDWLYNCWHDGDCWDLLAYINQTTSNIWNHFKRTDNSVILEEEILSNELNSTDNIKYNYTIFVPRKAGYADGDLLPVRMFFWFIDPADNLTCYDQNYRENETAETPICNPLMAQILGPMNDNISFVVDLKPGLPAGTYNIVRAIEIDPNGEWINYGQEMIGQIMVSEDNDEASISIEEVKTKVVEQAEQKVEEKISEPENMKQAGEEKESEKGLSKITGNVIEDILSSTKVNFVIGLLVAILFVLICLTFRVSKLTYKK